MRNVMFIILSQQILCNKLLLAITDEKKKSNFINEFKLELITTYHLKLLEKYCKNFVNLAFCNKEFT